jgi:hypothetical protein
MMRYRGQENDALSLLYNVRQRCRIHHDAGGCGWMIEHVHDLLDQWEHSIACLVLKKINIEPRLRIQPMNKQQPFSIHNAVICPIGL